MEWKKYKFLEHLNDGHINIRFTMEIETNCSLLFLDVLVMKKLDHSLACMTYKKLTVFMENHFFPHHKSMQSHQFCKDCLSWRVSVLTSGI
jgi:hypothetical protein